MYLGGTTTNYTLHNCCPNKSSILKLCSFIGYSIVHPQSQRMKHWYNFIIYSIMAAFITGCSFDNTGDPIIVPEVEKEFRVELREQLGPSPRRLQVLLQTVQLQPCINATIAHQLLPAPGLIRIDIAGIELPDNCPPGSAPALDTVQLSELTGNNLFFEVNLKNTISNEGTLRITDEAYTLNLATEKGLVVPHKQLRRIPDYIIWGYVGHSVPSAAGIAGQFVNEIFARSASANLQAGNYGHFSVAPGTGYITVADSPTDLTLRPFAFRFNGNVDDLRNITEAYRNQYGALLQIKLLAVTGEVF